MSVDQVRQEIRDTVADVRRDIAEIKRSRASNIDAIIWLGIVPFIGAVAGLLWAALR